MTTRRRKTAKKSQNTPKIKETIKVSYSVDGETYLTRKDAMRFLGILHRDTLRQNSRVLKLDAPYTWADMEKLFGLQALLNQVRGNWQYRRETMAWLVSNDKYRQVLDSYHFDFTHEFQRRKHDFYQQCHLS